ncbi:MAG TPA: hypothetical protein VH539_20465 [Gemmatimonadaceae bacterium]|jgi:hypothetical protein
MALEYSVTELPPVWPGKKTSYRKRAPFKTQWARTIDLLERELKHLGARKVQIACEIQLGDLRQDGQLRADARPGPAVILSFLDRDGQRQAYPCDTFAWWQDNLYAIAVVLEDLRRAERYGVQSALLRAGFKALPNAGATTPTLNTTQAVHLLARLGNYEGSLTDYTRATLESPDCARDSIRRARARAHPDAGGRNEDWTLLQEAERILRAHHGGAL